MSGNPSESSEQGKKHQTISLISGPQRRRVEVNAIELWNQREEGEGKKKRKKEEGAAVTQDNSVKSSFISAISSSFESASVQAGPSHITPSRARLTSERMHRLDVHANVGLSCGFTARPPSPLFLPSCLPHAARCPASPMGPIISCRTHLGASLQMSFCVRVREPTCARSLLSMRSDTHTHTRGGGGGVGGGQRERGFCRVK